MPLVTGLESSGQDLNLKDLKQGRESCQEAVPATQVGRGQRELVGEEGWALRKTEKVK